MGLVFSQHYMERNQGMRLFIFSGILVLIFGCASQLSAANLIVHATDANPFAIIQNANTVFTPKSDQENPEKLFQNSFRNSFQHSFQKLFQNLFQNISQKSSQRKNTKDSAIGFSNIQIDEKPVTDSAITLRLTFSENRIKQNIAYVEQELTKSNEKLGSIPAYLVKAIENNYSAKKNE